MMMKSMFAMMEIFTGSFQSKEAENIEELKKVIESNTTDYYLVDLTNTVLPEGKIDEVEQ